MTNIALIVLTLTLAADEPAEDNASSADTATTTVPKPNENATVDPKPSPAKSSAKISEDDIEVLDEVVDLQAEAAADPSAAWYGKGYPEPVRILALPTGRTVRAGGFDFVIDHRSTSAVYNKDSSRPFTDMWNNFGGFDSGMAVGLGLRYGILDVLDAGVYRVGGPHFDTYEFDARVRALRQDDAGVDLMIRGGISWFVVPDHQDAVWPFAQVFASRLLFNRLLATAGVMYHSNSSSSTPLGQKYADEKHKWSVAGAAGLEYRLAASVSLDAEVVSCASGFCSKNPAFSGGVKFFTNRHTFALVCGNTQYLTADGYITNTDTQWSKLVIGFNITREY
jgi:hypothetical protein